MDRDNQIYLGIKSRWLMSRHRLLATELKEALALYNDELASDIVSQKDHIEREMLHIVPRTFLADITKSLRK